MRGAADRGQVLKIGGPLYSDAMGDAGTYHGTYIGMLDHNLTTIASFLGGSPPEGGFRGVVHERLEVSTGRFGSQSDGRLSSKAGSVGS